MTARSRSSTLWAAEPVKCWRRLPYASGRDDPQVDRDAVLRRDLRAALAGVARRSGERVLDERRRKRLRVLCGGDQVDVLARLGQAASRAGDRDRLAGRVLEQIGRELLGDRQDVGEKDALGRPLGAQLLELRGDVLLGLRAQALHRANALVGDRLAQVVDRGDADLVEEAARGLRAKPRDAGHLDQGGRELRLELLGRRDRAGVEERLDLLLGRLADPGQLRDLPGAGQLRDRDGALAHRLGRVAVRVDAEAVRAVELVEHAELGECVGDLCVGRVLLCHSA